MGACNQWSGLCEPVAGLSQDGGLCDTGVDCESGFCLEQDSAGPGSYPGGYCTSLCSLTEGLCPGDGACLGVGYTLVGFCFDGCVGDFDCRTGYTCQNFGSNVCFY